MEKWKDKLTDQLCQAFLSLKNTEETYSFLSDVATIGEIRALAQRLEVARLLSEGFTYPQIAQQTGFLPRKKGNSPERASPFQESARSFA